jgi:hypothetical protein
MAFRSDLRLRAGSFISLPLTLPLTLSLSLALACGAPDETTTVEAIEPVDFGGVYRVTGLTTETASGSEREIKGIVVLKQEGASYTATFDMRTGFQVDREGEGESIAVDLIGSGSGVRDGDQLRGTARTQLVRAAIPGVDAKFPFLPREIGPRIVSVTQTRMLPGNVIEVEIETQADDGESYAATTTIVRGQRLGNVGELPSLPNVAAPPPH